MLFGKLLKFNSVTPLERLFFTEAWLIQLWAGFILKIVPFRRIPGLFAGLPENEPGNNKDHKEKRPEQITEKVTEQVKIAIRRASGVSPWKNKCLVSSLTARRMLNRRKIRSQLFLGMTKGSGGKPLAHAWLKAGEQEIVEKNGEYLTLMVF